MNYRVDENTVIKFCGKLKEILMYELALGNTIAETFEGNWPYPSNIAILLEKPFISPIQRNLDNIEFHNINDPHSWKAEYYDKTNALLLGCRFEDSFDFKDM